MPLRVRPTYDTSDVLGLRRVEAYPLCGCGWLMLEGPVAGAPVYLMEEDIMSSAMGSSKK